MSAGFSFDAEKAVAAVAFLASRGIPDLTKGKICKLIFLADKHHLVRFGRPVTGDRICAMKDGPVPSGVLNILNGMLAGTGDLLPAVSESGIAVNRTFTNPHFEAKEFRMGEFLSESDIEALNDVVRAYGGKTFSELRGLTHDMPAYKNAREDRSNEAPKMAFEDFFEEDDEAIEGALEEMKENARLRKAFAFPAV